MAKKTAKQTDNKKKFDVSVTFTLTGTVTVTGDSLQEALDTFHNGSAMKYLEANEFEERGRVVHCITDNAGW